ncbi:hypothetical protein CL614_10440 [archaeon]|nr:hypothetical protein [archaeon]|tara:strand:+ start:56 stop:1105 length:1050 start_codon:yes stop_codon:yes gene_type:complete
MLTWFKNLFRKKLQLPPSSFIPEEPGENDAFDDEVFGSMEFGSRPSKDWRKFRPVHEIQSYGDCVSFSRLNCAESQAKIDGVTDDNGEELNFSDLYLAVKSGTSQRGNSLKRVAEYARKHGIVLEKFCEYTRSWGQRASRVASTPSYAKRYKLGNYAWVKRDSKGLDRNYIKNSQEKGPIQIGVGLGETYRYAGEVITPPKNISVWHALESDYTDEVDQVYAYDHYNRANVVFSADYPITFAMTFKDLPENWRGEGVDESKFYNRMIGKFILRAEGAGELYEVLEDKMVKIVFTISNKKIWDALHETLRPMIVGVNEKDFKRLEQVAFKAEGVKEADAEIILSKYFKID